MGLAPWCALVDAVSERRVSEWQGGEEGDEYARWSLRSSLRLLARSEARRRKPGLRWCAAAQIEQTVSCAPPSRVSHATHLVERLDDLALLLGPQVKAQYPACIDDEGNDGDGDHKGDEQAGDGVEARPAVPLDEERADDDAHGPKRVGHDVQVHAHHVVRVAVPVIMPPVAVVVPMRMPMVVPVRVAVPVVMMTCESEVSAIISSQAKPSQLTSHGKHAKEIDAQSHGAHDEQLSGVVHLGRVDDSLHGLKDDKDAD